MEPSPLGGSVGISLPSLYPLFKIGNTEAQGNLTCCTRVPPLLFLFSPPEVGRRQTSDPSLAWEQPESNLPQTERHMAWPSDGLDRGVPGATLGSGQPPHVSIATAENQPLHVVPWTLLPPQFHLFPQKPYKVINVTCLK